MMTSCWKFILVLVIIVATSACCFGGDTILVLQFDCQGKTRPITSTLEDSLKANLKLLDVPTVPRSKWRKLIQTSGYDENDLNYNPPLLGRLAEKLQADGAVYGQVYEKNGMLILDAYYIEAGGTKPFDIDPMIGYQNEDILEMTWSLAVIIAQEDKQPPRIIRVEPTDSTITNEQYIDFQLYFDEPMNPESFGLTGEPQDMFFEVGDYTYSDEDYCFKFKMHLYPGKQYKFQVNGPGAKPFMDVYGNVAETYEWQVITK